MAAEIRYTAAPLFGDAAARTFASWDALIDYAHTPTLSWPLVIRADGRPLLVIGGTFSQHLPDWSSSAIAAGHRVWYDVQDGAASEVAIAARSRTLCDRLEVADEPAVIAAVRAAFEALS